ncbi:MAG TPA: Asp-tRNA(Asn)/Glu-tRNA(Gln) amidotransferase subunit GatB [Candidatus Paceibacterota bacterium]|nr:Asp-tRNA(Asn)/Glu-tRNA(Gln) amidotransferase subunit GatB [Candidatus Paceibacterota bacterium]
MEYRPTIGLEVHAELSTRTKMFCDCRNDPDEREPNVNICPICLAHPGTLPSVNEEAVRHIARVGTAIGGKLADFTEFDRKSYFYPDIPKGYQISQYEYPFIAGGTLAGILITRVHLEEDTARSSHAATGSLVDFNRAGVPLMELVTEPVIHDAETAGRFARELQLLLRTLAASHANLEKGEMRVEANISISKDDTFGTKVEVKNLNSFRAVERAIAFEIERQARVLDGGGTVVQETRGWNEDNGETFSQRAKEGSADYRYFPEPDIPKLMLSEIPWLAPDAIRAGMPELPWERRDRYAALGLKQGDVEYLAGTNERAAFFDAVLANLADDAGLVPTAGNYLVSDVAGWFTKKGIAEDYALIAPESFASLMRMIGRNELSSRGAKEVLILMLDGTGTDPETLAKEAGFLQVSDAESLRTAVQEVIAANESVAAEYRAGKVAVIQYLVGQGMRATKGAGNPGVIRQLLEEELSEK